MATPTCRGCGKPMSQPAAAGGGSLCAECAKKAAAPAKSAVPEDLELVLVKPPEPSPDAQRPHRVPRHRLPEPVAGKPIDAGDPMRLYLIAGAALVATVLGGLWYFLRETPSAKTSASASASGSGGATSTGASSTPPSGGKKSAAAAGSGAQQKSGASTASGTPAPAFNANNPSNKRCFHAYLNFMTWAYREGMELKSEDLVAKYKEQISVNGVDDPEVKGVYNRGLQVLKLGTYPLKTGTVVVAAGQDPAVARAKATEDAKVRKTLLLEINAMAKKAERRYGRPPPPPKPEPGAKTAVEAKSASEPAPAPEAGKTEEPPSLKPAE